MGSVPSGFSWNGEAIVICSAVNAPKVPALAERPEVAVTIDVGGTPADSKALLVRGAASLETVEGIPPEYIAASAKVLARSDVAEFERQVQGTYEQMVRITIAPSWARYFDFGAARRPSFLQDVVSKQ